MKTKITKWGNSLALRIPARVAEELKLENGCDVELKVDENKFIVKKITKRYTLEELIEGITPENVHHDVWENPDPQDVVKMP
jgi:antitoxin MazE